MITKRIFRVLLSLYPPWTRREFGEEMLSFMEIRWRRAGKADRTAGFWLELSRDVVGSVPAAWWGGFLDMGRGMMGALLRDLGVGLRSLRRRPGFAVISITTLALGIGAATALFSVVDPLLLRPLPYPDSDRLVVFWTRAPAYDVEKDWLAPAHFEALRERVASLEEVSLFGGGQSTVLADDAPAEFWGAIQGTSGLLRLLGARPAMGRLLQIADDEAGGALVAVLTHDTWVSRFASDPDIVGTTLQLGPTTFEVVGVIDEATPVTPEALPTVSTLPRIDVFVNLQLGPEFLSDTDRWNWNIMARIREGSSIEQVRADLGQMIGGDFLADFDIDDPRFEFLAIPLLEEIVGGLRPLALALLGAVGLVLLISCGNVATLLLARGALRRREMGVRRALGAGRARMVGQLLAENLGISVVAGGVGVGLAWGSLELFLRFGPDDLPRLAEVAIDARILLFAFVASLMTTMIFGLLPAFQATRSGVAAALRSGDRSGSDTTLGLRARLNTGLAIASSQIALALVLLVAAGLLVRSYAAVSTDDPGFDREQILTLLMDLGPEGPPRAERWSLVSDMLDGIRALPGVQAAGVTNLIPLGSKVAWGGATVAGQDGESVMAEFRSVSPGYFEAMGIDVTQGRSFEAADMVSESPVGIVDEALVRRYWPGQNPLGLTVGLGSDSLRVVGVAETVRQFRLDEDSPRVFIYYPYAGIPTRSFYLVLRSSVPPETLVAPVRRIIHDFAPSAPLAEVQPVAQLVNRVLATRRAGSALMAAFAVISLALSVIGTYGLVTFRVASARREIGIRLALGADPHDVVKMVTRLGLTLGGVGVGLGLPGAFVAGRLLSNQLFGVQAADPVTFAFGALVLMAVAVCAARVPAVRASRMDPALVFRAE